MFSWASEHLHFTSFLKSKKRLTITQTSYNSEIVGSYTGLCKSIISLDVLCGCEAYRPTN
jgi:hypothetical protein